MINAIRRMWHETIVDIKWMALKEREYALKESYPLSDEIPELLNSKLQAQKELFKAEAKLNGCRKADGADYAIFVAILVALAWCYVSEMDYRDIVSGSSAACVYRGR